jgi:hypothetical protein
MFGSGLTIVILALIFGGFYYWARRQGLLAAEQAAEEQTGRRISLLTEAVAYIGAILLLAGGIAAISQRWNSLGDWGQVGVLAGAAAFFLLVGILVRRVREPAIQRLVGVVWFLSAACVGGAAGSAAHNISATTGAATVLAVGVAGTVYSAALWLIRRRALQNAALFTGLVITICGIIATFASGSGQAHLLGFSLALWGFGVAWAWLGWRRYVEPIWVTMPCGAILALYAPILTVGSRLGVRDWYRHCRRGHGRQYPAAEHAVVGPGHAGDVRVRHLGGASVLPSVAGGSGRASYHRSADPRPGCRQRTLDARRTSAQARGAKSGGAITPRPS